MGSTSIRYRLLEKAMRLARYADALRDVETSTVEPLNRAATLAEEMAARFMLPDRMYPQVSLLSMSVGPMAVFVGAMLAALYPALRLFRLQPVAAMRAL